MRDGHVVAPQPLTLSAPTDVSQIGSDDLELRWTPSNATQIAILLVASTSDGRWAQVRCTGDDTTGRISIGAPLLAALPAPPRDLQLQVSRDQIERVPSARDGDGVVLHAAQQISLQGRQP